MNPITGVFRSTETANKALELLRQAAIPEKNIALLAPGTELKTTGTEQSGMGEAVGGVVGGAVGIAAASMLIPGIGPVLVAGAAALGVTGAVAGAAAGHAMEAAIFDGLPADERFFYEDALRQGRAVVVAFPRDEAEEEAARSALETAGAESIDAARDEWWLGIRDDERVHYHTRGGDFDKHELAYRRGFQAALDPRIRGALYEDARDYLAERYPEASGDAFRHGFERGRDYYLKRGGSIHG